MRSIGMASFVATAALACAGTALAQSVNPPQSATAVPMPTRQAPMVDQRIAFQEPPPQSEVPIGAVEDLQGEAGVETVTHSTDCDFCNAVSSYDDACCRARGCGPLSKMKSALYAWQNGTGECDGYPCANCYSCLDIEKRVFFTYVHGNACKPSTRISVGDFDGGQLGAEFLPWVLQDGSELFTRMGFAVIGQYSRLYGNHLSSTQSQLSGGTLNVDNGDMWSLIIAGVYRMDFDFLGIRISPNAMMGGTFDWIDVNPAHYGGTVAREVDFFKLTGFGCGFYARWMFDFGITERINIGIGMDFRASQTDVMQDEHDLRKHTGLVIGMSHTF